MPDTTMTRPTRVVLHRGRADTERGSVLIWFVGTAPVLLLMVALLVDGGAKIQAGEQAATDATQAARAAALAAGPQSVGTATDTGAATTAAQAFLTRAGAEGSVRVTGPATVTVTVTVHRTGPISGATFTITRTATAHLLVGVGTGHTP